MAEKARESGDVLRLGAGTIRTRIVGAAYSHDPAISAQVLGLLPELVHLHFENGGDCLDDTVRLLGRELAHPQMASAIVLNSLIDILLVQLLRTWLAANPDRRDTSWLGALGRLHLAVRVQQGVHPSARNRQDDTG